MGRHSGVATWLRWRYQSTLQKRRRYNVSLWRLCMRRCNDVICVMLSDVFITCNHMAMSERHRLAMPQQRYNDAGVSNRVETTETKISKKTEVVKNYKYRSIYSQSCCKKQAVADIILVSFLNLKTGFTGFQQTALYGTTWKTGNCIF